MVLGFENTDAFLVEPMGFEPTTSSMPSRRAPNCATAPPGILQKFIIPRRELTCLLPVSPAACLSHRRQPRLRQIQFMLDLAQHLIIDVSVAAQLQSCSPLRCQQTARKLEITSIRGAIGRQAMIVLSNQIRQTVFVLLLNFAVDAREFVSIFLSRFFEMRQRRL